MTRKKEFRKKLRLNNLNEGRASSYCDLECGFTPNYFLCPDEAAPLVGLAEADMPDEMELIVVPNRNGEWALNSDEHRIWHVSGGAYDGSIPIYHRAVRWLRKIGLGHRDRFDWYLEF